MLFGKILLAEEGRNNLQIARQVLMDEYGLVPPKNDFLGATEKDIVIWEDSEKIGRYRVHFYNHLRRYEEFHDAIQFKYWMNSARMKREIFFFILLYPLIFKSIKD